MATAAARFNPDDPNADPLVDPTNARQALIQQLGPDDPGATPAPTSHTEAAAIPRNPAPLPPSPTTATSPSGPATGAPPAQTNPAGPPPAGYIPPTTGPFAPGATPAAPGGAGTFQAGSPNDPTKYTDPKTLLGLQLNQGLTPQDAANAVNQYFNLPSGSSVAIYHGTGPNGTDILSIPSGYFTNNGGTWVFNPRGPEGGNTGAGAGGAGTSIQIPQVNQDWQQKMRDLLTSQLAAESTPVTADSPQVAPAISAYRDQSNRDQQAARDALVEQLYAHGGEGGVGLNSGALQTGITQNAEKAATSRASFAGNAVLSTSEAQLTHLNQLLQTATQYGLTDQAQQIQTQIASIQAQLQREGLGINLAEFMAGLNQNAALAGLNG